MKKIKLAAAIISGIIAIASSNANSQPGTNTYRCNGGRTFQATFLPNSARVRLDRDRILTLRQVRSASGTRYSDGRTTLSTRGNEAFIQVGNRITYDRCTIETARSSGATFASVTGTVTYRERIALPPNARVRVRLQDISRLDIPPITLTEQVISTDGRQVPFEFTLIYEPSKIDPNRIYAVDAQILTEGQVRYINNRTYRVITQGNPTNVEVVVQPIKR